MNFILPFFQRITENTAIDFVIINEQQDGF
jgi:hypothetical protein